MTISPAKFETLDLNISLAPLTRRTPGVEVARRALATGATKLVRALARSRVDDDAEWIHQARSATRAIRANLKAFAPIFDVRESFGLANGLRRLAHCLGRVRDNDVLIGHVTALAQCLPEPDRSAVDALITRLRALREETYADLLADLRGEAYPRLLEDLVRAVSRDSPLIVHPHAIGRRRLARDVVAKPWRRLRRAVRACGDKPTVRQLHVVRISAKRCRYAAEAVAPLNSKTRAAAAHRFVKRLGNLSDTLGAFHDAVIEQERLRQLTGAEADRFAAGQIAGLETALASLARSAWRKAWKRVAQRGVHFWRKRLH